MWGQDFFPAIRRGDWETVCQLVRRCPYLARQPHPSGVSPALFALYHEQRRLAFFLARRKGQLDVCELAALGLAGRLRRRLEAQPWLAAQVAPDGTSALGLAAWFGQGAACRVLLAYEAQPDQPAQNELARTPLHLAVLAGQEDIVEEFLRRGADPNTADAEGHTALHLAASKGEPGLVRLLLQYGAQAWRNNRLGLKPWQLAQIRGKDEVAAVLLQAQAGLLTA